ncbi:hypothetical protein M406DRAFT_260043 [Cryphonectria parasitica EP155]|uniref:Uncharacterized protein n=1 Tax=Cryphonectria parasitica (strain ATCC 38755 / EP155) TaxID=660469 RepID=A0A9P5CNT8_CRYP1|nr:uncharacterized protein M406DRAFT_260043 [Cryphonectria parasitica EP155]KAF3764466.1 hypothetical protein M406DRAFT_260043 [Cryphonectria parasitica EP155]
MSWMDSWSRPSKHQATPAPFYLISGGEDTPYCHSCGRVISSRRTPSAAADSKTPVKYCSSRCRSHKPGKLEREIEAVFVSFLNGERMEQLGEGPAGQSHGVAKKGSKRGAGKKMKGDARILVPCDQVERHMFDRDDAGTEGGHTDSSLTDPEHTSHDTQPPDQHPSSSGTLEDPTSSSSSPPIDYDVLARLSIRSGTRIRPPQDVSEVNGSVGGEKGRAERVEETDEMLEKRREGLRRARQREMVRCAARRGVVFGFEVDTGQTRKCEAVMLGKVVEPSFAKGDWSVRWRE